MAKKPWTGFAANFDIDLDSAQNVTTKITMPNSIKQTTNSDAPLNDNTAAHERIYRQLRNDVLYGALKPGQNLTLRGVANDFDTSITPAREALRRLMSEGALRLSATGRYSVNRLNRERIEELATLRSLLEPELASRALPRAHSALIDRLSSINGSIEQMMMHGNMEKYIQANLDFHRALYLRAQSPAMLALVETIWLQLGPTMGELYESKEKTPSPELHRRIIGALRAGDDPGLRLAIRMDVTSGLRMLMR